jgi:hypothetical protein
MEGSPWGDRDGTSRCRGGQGRGQKWKGSETGSGGRRGADGTLHPAPGTPSRPVPSLPLFGPLLPSSPSESLPFLPFSRCWLAYHMGNARDTRNQLGPLSSLPSCFAYLCSLLFNLGVIHRTSERVLVLSLIVTLALWIPHRWIYFNYCWPVLIGFWCHTT